MRVAFDRELDRLLTWQKARITEQEFGMINKKKRQEVTREEPPYRTLRGGEVVSGVRACFSDIEVGGYGKSQREITAIFL